MKKKIFIDTDMGMDDIIAICMLLQSDKFEIIGFSTVFGLVEPNKGKNNLDKLRSYLQTKNIAVAGSNLALDNTKSRKFPQNDIENSSNLVFLKSILPTSNTSSQNKQSATDEIFKAVATNPNEVDIICLGPLTNIARIIDKYGKEFTSNIKGLTIMGGNVFCKGNVGSCDSEYNFYLDPQAADIVFSTQIPITLISLDSTYQVPATKAFKVQIKAAKPKSKAGQIIKKTILANDKDFEYFYDPLVAAVLMEPSLIKKNRIMNIKISQSANNLGKCIYSQDPKGNVNLVKKIDKKSFYKLISRLI